MLHRRMIGNTLRPLNFLIKVGDDPLDLAAYTVKFRMEGETTGASKVAESDTGVTKQPTQVFTADATGLATCNGHGIKEGQQVVVASSGTLPSGLVANVRYYAVNVTPNAFGLASVPGGVSVITGAGSGTHTFYVVGSGQKVFLAADVDTEARFSAWITVYSGSAAASTPVAKEGMIVEFYSYGAA